MVQSAEQGLLNHLRKTLRNSLIHITYKISENQEERRPYTSTEIFAAMARKNPTLLKLRDELGLDTEY